MRSFKFRLDILSISEADKSAIKRNSGIGENKEEDNEEERQGNVRETDHTDQKRM